MNDQNNQDLIKLLQESQKSNRVIAITGICSTILGTLTTLILAWKSLFQKKKSSAALRLIRIEAAMARLQLEKEHIKKEVAHEAERLKLETGLRQEDATEETDLVSQHKKYLADKNGLVDKLKNQGESFLKDKVNQFTRTTNEKIDEITKTKPKKEE